MKNEKKQESRYKICVSSTQTTKTSGQKLPDISWLGKMKIPDMEKNYQDFQKSVKSRVERKPQYKVIPKEYEQNSSNKNIEKRRDNVNSNRKIEKAKSFAEIVKQIGNKEADRGMVENSIFFNDTRTTFRDDEGNSRPLQV